MNLDTDHSGINLLGLGLGDPYLLTREAWEWLQAAPEIVLRARNNPIVHTLPATTQVISFDSLFDQDEPVAEVIGKIVDHILELGKRPQGVTFAVPGHPLEADIVCAELMILARKANMPVRIIPGISLAETALSLVGKERASAIAFVDGLDLGRVHMPSFPPTSPALITQLNTLSVVLRVKETLLNVYPPQHTVQWVDPAKSAIRSIPLEELDLPEHKNPYAILVLPPLGEGTSFEAFQEIIAHLRAPNGCPWDRQQTHLSLRTHLLEEAYETLEALDKQDVNGMVEELGDLLLQIVLHAQIATEAGEFRMADVIHGISEKLIRRHPHVFGDVQVQGVKGVLQNWEKLKAAEREANEDENGKKGLMSGVPAVFPSLAQAQELQDRAARVGFDWPAIEGVLEKIAEEIEEVRAAPDNDARTRELGDLLFSVVNLARWDKIDAESALRETNARFRARFSHIERAAQERNIALGDLSVDEMNRLWDEAKSLE